MAGGAFVMRNASATFDTTEYNDQLTKTELVPDTTVEQLKTLDPATVHSDVDEPSYVFSISGPQDWEVATGLAEFLRTNHGQSVEVVFQPKPGTDQPIATFSVICMVPPFGGERGSWAMLEMDLPVDGDVAWSRSI